MVTCPVGKFVDVDDLRGTRDMYNYHPDPDEFYTKQHIMGKLKLVCNYCTNNGKAVDPLVRSTRVLTRKPGCLLRSR